MPGRTKAAAPRLSSDGVVRALPLHDDAAVVMAMRSGRLDAAGTFYDRHVDTVRAVVFRLMGPDQELDDVVQDVFLRALESLHRLEHPSALRSWLLGIAVHAVKIRFQTRSRRRWLRFMANEELPEHAAFPDVENGEALREVYAVLDTLTAEERIAVVLHRVEELGLEDAARCAGLSLATFRRRLAKGEQKFFARARGRPALADYLSPHGRFP